MSLSSRNYWQKYKGYHMECIAYRQGLCGRSDCRHATIHICNKSCWYQLKKECNIIPKVYLKLREIYKKNHPYKDTARCYPAEFITEGDFGL